MPKRKESPARRPRTMFREETVRMILIGIFQGAPRTVAARMGGVSYSTLQAWVESGRKVPWACPPDKPRDEFTARELEWLTVWDCPWVPTLEEILERAEARRMIRWLRGIDTAGAEGKWQAYAWKLERTAPHEFGLRKPVDPDVDRSVEQILAVLTKRLAHTDPDALEEIANALLGIDDGKATPGHADSETE